MTNYAGGIGAIDATKTNTGQTSTHAGFGQAAYRFRPGWDVTAGVRYEDWSASNGVVGSTVVPDRNLTATSPKVSLGYESGNWKYRYSFGRAHRFPVIAELFQALSTPSQLRRRMPISSQRTQLNITGLWTTSYLGVMFARVFSAMTLRMLFKV